MWFEAMPRSGRTICLDGIVIRPELRQMIPNFDLGHIVMHGEGDGQAINLRFEHRDLIAVRPLVPVGACS